MVKTQNIANSGEFYVASLLSAYDCTVTITPGKNGRQRQDTTMREIAIIQKNHFPEKWEIQKIRKYYKDIQTILDF